jgi:hypothetical protein
VSFHVVVSTQELLDRFDKIWYDHYTSIIPLYHYTSSNTSIFSFHANSIADIQTCNVEVTTVEVSNAVIIVQLMAPLWGWALLAFHITHLRLPYLKTLHKSRTWHKTTIKHHFHHQLTGWAGEPLFSIPSHIPDYSVWVMARLADWWQPL